MTTLFADTFYFLALVNQSDPAHVKAAGFETESARLVTTVWVLTEVGDSLSSPENRPLFLTLLQTLRNSPDVHLVPASDELFARGVALFQQRPDKEWSLTDCISFAVMGELKLTDALTGDRHFTQAGFRALLKDN